ncbi:transporter substrate-binding domain-containing protein, partial [Aquaspirillum serpens]|uniref:transporter substrate-binding domain-containing protein n=1 Tax=Aquaspirillum serpens TaxID=190 RepID=UPI001B7FC3AE
MMKIASFCLILLLGIGLSQPVVAAHSVSLSAEEQRYLAQHPVIKVCVDPDWAPFERINEQGQHEGIGADLLQLVAKRVGIRVELYPVLNWEESLAASKSGRCQIMSFLNQTPAREKWLIFTEPVFYDQNAIITREEHPFIPCAVKPRHSWR